MGFVILLLLFFSSFCFGFETDHWGYAWEWAREFDWHEIAGIGTRLTLSADDEAFAVQCAGFPFYESYYDTLFITSNGLISFESPTRAYRNQAFPADTVPPCIAPFWDDLSPQNGGAIFYYIDPIDSSFIVEWHNTPHYSSGGPYTFELILKKCGDIEFSYLSLNDPLNSSTIGMQYYDHILQLLYNGDRTENIPRDSATIYIRRLNREIRIDSLLSPPSVVRSTEAYYPSLKVENLGILDTSLVVTIQIENGRGEVVYAQTIDTRVPPHSSIVINFDVPWSPAPGESLFHLTGFVYIPEDEYPQDDTIRANIFAIVRDFIVFDSYTNPETATFDWEEISTTGVNTGLAGDDAVIYVDMIPFFFPFVDTLFGGFYVSTNGFLSFTDNRSDYNNQSIPCDLRDILAVFWDDLVLNNPTSGIYYALMNDTSLVVEWKDVNHYRTGGPYTFEVILYSSGIIKYQYLSVGSPLDQSTIGLQRGLGEVISNLYLFNGTPPAHLPSDSFAIMYVPLERFARLDAQLYSVLTNLSYLSVGSFCTLNVAVKNNGTVAINCFVRGKIFEGTSLVYEGEAYVENLLPLATRTVSLVPAFEVPSHPDSFVGCFYVVLEGDHNPSNDTINVRFRSTNYCFIEVRGEGELTSLGGRDGSHYFAQGFKATGDTLLDAGVSIFGALAPYPDIRLELWRSRSDGLPDTSRVVFVGRRLDGRREITETPRRYSLGITSPIPLERDSIYYIVANGLISREYSGYCGVYASFSNPYPYGAGYWSNDRGVSWTNSPFDGLDFEFYILLSQPTGIEKRSPPASFDLSVYPNPANGIFTINAEVPEVSKVEIYNITGEKLWEKSIEKGRHRITPTIELSSGIYFIRLENVITKKAVIIK